MNHSFTRAVKKKNSSNTKKDNKKWRMIEGAGVKLEQNEKKPTDS